MRYFACFAICLLSLSALAAPLPANDAKQKNQSSICSSKYEENIKTIGKLKLLAKICMYGGLSTVLVTTFSCICSLTGEEFECLGSVLSVRKTLSLGSTLLSIMTIAAGSWGIYLVTNKIPSTLCLSES